jgi:hypothetical protein
MSTTLKPSLKIFIASEDKVAFLRARQLERQLEALSGGDMEIRPVFWNFALLRHAGLGESATAEAMDADMVVISVHKNGELPAHVQAWLDKLPARTDGHGALVALVGAPAAFPNGETSCVNYLRHLAATRGMDFICNQDNYEPSDIFEPAFSSFEQMPARALAPAGVGSN